MSVLLLLRGIGWLACVVYATIPLFWLIIHPRAEYWRSRLWSPYRFLVPLWVGMWLALGTITAPWRTFLLYRAEWAWAAPAAALFGAGLLLYRLSGAGLQSGTAWGLA